MFYVKRFINFPWGNSWLDNFESEMKLKRNICFVVLEKLLNFNGDNSE